MVLADPDTSGLPIPCVVPAAPVDSMILHTVGSGDKWTRIEGHKEERGQCCSISAILAAGSLLPHLCLSTSIAHLGRL